jgi:hypothetical protein
MPTVRSYDLGCRPKLACTFLVDGEKAILSRDGREFDLAIPDVDSMRRLGQILAAMDGSKSISELLEDFQLTSTSLFEVLHALDEHALFDDCNPCIGRSGIEVLLDLEDLANDLLYKSLYKNAFWQNITSTTSSVPRNVLYGLAIENYHFLFRESYFDAGALSFQPSTRARLLMNEFYAEEYGHDELLLKGLNAIGIGRDDLMDTLPLQETMALCNALAYWSNFDTLFFFSTIGILEGKDIKEDSYLAACDRANLDPAFISPIRAHSNINLEGEHGSITRSIFREITSIDHVTVERYRRQTHLFVEIYDNFYKAVWEHYSNAAQLLRRVSDI